MTTVKNFIEITLDEAKAIKFDVIVIGSGAAGSSAALSLAERHANVLIIDSGPLVFTEHVGSSAWRNQPNILKNFAETYSNYTTWTSNSHLQSKEQVWSLVGGRTVFWGGHAPRFLASDFDAWPITYNDIRSDYLWAEELMHVSIDFFSSQTQDQIINLLLHDAISVQPSPLALESKPKTPSTLPHLLYSGINELLLSPYFSTELTQTGIHLVSKAHAHKLHVSAGSIIGLDVINMDTQKILRLQADKYVLCCGALRSNLLVLNSKLFITCTKLGKCIGEHLFAKGLLCLDQPLSEPIYLFVPPSKEHNFMFELQGTFNQTWYEANYATVWLNWQKHTPYVLLYGFGEAEVREENVISLTNNALGYHVTYNRTKQDMMTFENMQATAAKIANSLNARLVKYENQPPGSSLHERGGLIMGTNSRESVVDVNGKFWDYANLYCADAAIWPSQGAANSCLTITALAHYVARKIK